jgi:flagellar brake protein
MNTAVAEDMQEERPLKFELMQSEKYAQFLLHSGTEIRNVLKALRENHSLVTIYFNEGTDFLLSFLVDLSGDEKYIILDCGADEEANYLAAASEKLIFITSLAKVKIQWICPKLERVTHEGRDAFRCIVPNQMLRLQRRDYYRLTMRQEDRVRCLIPYVADGKRYSLEANVVDISGGGVAVVVPPLGINIEPDHVFQHCNIDLGELGSITADLQIRSVFEVTLRDGTRCQRSGCRFVGLSSAASATIQRYILQMERERRAFAR